MINIPAGLEKVIKSNNHGPLKSIVYMYRNKWNAEALKYEVENTPVNITSYLTKAANLILQLDISEVNRYDASNVTLTLKNVKNEFVEGVEGSFFTEGYLLYGSKFEYYVGASDALKVLMYTGTIAEQPTYRTEEYQVDIRVVSDLELFKNFQARDFSNSVKKEKLSGSFPNYATYNKGVGSVLKVYSGTDSAAETELILGIDYKVSDIGSLSVPASIVITNESLFTKKFYADYYYWKRDLEIHEAVGGLLDIVGVPEDKREVYPVVFNTQGKEIEPVTSIALGLGYKMTSPKNFQFSWTNTRNGVWNNLFSQNSVEHRYSTFPINFTINFRNGIIFETDWPGPLGTQGHYGFGDQPNTIYGDHLPHNGIIIDRVSSATSSYNRIIRYENGQGTVVAQTATQPRPGGIRVKDGTLYVFDTSGSTDYSAPLWFTPSYEVIRAFSNTRVTVEGYVISLSADTNLISTDTDSYGSPTILTNTLEYSGFSFGAFLASLEGGNFQYSLAYRESEDGATFAPPIQTDINIISNSTANYLKWIFTITNIPPAGCNVLNLELSYIINSFLLNLVNLSDKTVLESLEDLALISGYEFGFSRNNTFFFRQRIKSTDAVKILSDNEIIKVSTVKKNLKNLFTKIVINFAENPLQFLTNDYETTRPTLQDKYGILTKTIDKPDIVNFNSPLLANAIAPQLLEIFGVLNNTITATGALDLSLELGDIISLRRNAPLTVDKNSADFNKYTKTQTYYKACKIIGLNYNFQNRQMTYTLLDVSNKNTQPQNEADVFKYQFKMQFGQKD